MKKLILILMCIGLLSLPLSAMAATSAEKQAAIDEGLAYLATQATVSGDQAYWSYYGTGYGTQAATGAALLAIIDQYYKPLQWNGANYNTLVTKGINYLLSTAQPINLTPNWTGVGGANVTGLIWGGPANGYDESTYTTGIVIPALARLVNNPYGGAAFNLPSDPISSTNLAVNGLTYSQVLQKTINTLAWGQTGPGTNRYGGWRYVPNSGDSDMSTTQWPVIDFLFTKPAALGVSVPNLGPMKTALQAWLTACQVGSGGVEYQPGAGIINATHAGGFLLSNFFAGGGGSVANALAWLNGDWKTAPNNTWYGNEGNPYAMWAVYKALETIYGTSGSGPITNLNPQGANLIDPGATWNWWEDYCQFLVDSQLGNGSWNGFGYWSGALEAAWYINILNATTTGGGGGEVPEPATMILLGSGLLGLAGYARKKFKK